MSGHAGRPTRWIAAPVAVALAALLAACGGGTDGGAGGSASPTGAAYGVHEDAKLAARVPKAIRDKGTLTVVADASNPPTESFAADGRTIVGLDPDIAKAVGTLLGLRVRVVNGSFDAILPGLQSQRYDLGVSSVTDTKERERTFTFVTYLRVGTAFYTKAGTPTVQRLSDLCGRAVAMEKGTSQQVDAQKQATACRKAGRAAPKVLLLPDQNGANQAVQSGRAEVGMADYPVVAKIVSAAGGQFTQSRGQYGVAPYGIAMRKGTDLEAPVRDAVQRLVDDGTYAQILKRWGLSGGAIRHAEIDGAVS